MGENDQMSLYFQILVILASVHDFSLQQSFY